MRKIINVLVLILFIFINGCAVKEDIEIGEETLLRNTLKDTNVVKLESYFWLGRYNIVAYMKNDAEDSDYKEIEKTIREFFLTEEHMESYISMKHDYIYNIYLVRNKIIKPRVINSNDSKRSFSVIISDCSSYYADNVIKLKTDYCVWQMEELID